MRRTRDMLGWRARAARGGGRTAQECQHWPDLSLAAVFVFGGLYEPIVCLIEISPYRIDIGNDLGIVRIFSLDHGRRIPCLDNGALRRSQVWIICAQCVLRRSRWGHDSLANQYTSCKDCRGNDGAQNHFASCHREILLPGLLQEWSEACKGKMREQRRLCAAMASSPEVARSGQSSRSE